MGIVISTCLLIGLICIAFWLYSLYNSAVADRLARQSQEREEALRLERERKDSLLRKPGVMLRCMSCNAAFPAPLPDIGCPECHIASFVVTEEEYQKSKEEARNIVENN
jgi:hypothetical protein